MLIDNKYLNSFANSIGSQHEEGQEFQAQYHLLKIKCIMLNNPNMINLVKSCENNNRLFISPKVYGITRNINNQAMVIKQKIEEKYLKEIKLDKLCFVKKIFIIIRYLSLLEYAEAKKQDFHFSKVLINEKFELSLNIDPLKEYYHSRKILITENIFHKNITVKKHVFYLTDILKEMFPILKFKTALNIDLIFNYFTSNIYDNLKKLFCDFLFFSVQLDKSLLNFLKSKQFLDGERENYFFLIELQNLFLNYFKSTKITKKSSPILIMENFSEYFQQNKQKMNEFDIINEISISIKSFPLENETQIVKEISFGMGKINYKSRINKFMVNHSQDQKNSKKDFIDKDNNNYKLKYSLINLDDLFPHIALTEESNKIFKKRSNLGENKNVNSNEIKENKFEIIEKYQAKKYDSTKRQMTHEDLPEISNYVFKNLNIEFDLKKEKKDVNMINAHHFLSFKKSILKNGKYNLQNSNFIHNLKNNLYLPNVRINSGTKNVKNILKEYSSFNKDYISRVMSPKPQNF